MTNLAQVLSAAQTDVGTKRCDKYGQLRTALVHVASAVMCVGVGMSGLDGYTMWYMRYDTSARHLYNNPPVQYESG